MARQDKYLIIPIQRNLYFERRFRTEIWDKQLKQNQT